MKAYFTITQNCNLECAHCYCEAGPGKPSMPIREVRQVIDNLAEDTIELMVSGGEPFTRRSLLYKTLAYAQKKGIRFLNIETNGSWATSETRAQKILDEVEQFGNIYISVASPDIYHEEAGLDLNKVLTLSDILEERGLGALYYARKWKRHKVFPLGRARNLDEKLWDCQSNRHTDFMSCARLEYNAIANIHLNGMVYPCCFRIPGTELGDAREERVKEIIKSATKREAVKILARPRGPQKLAREAGMDKEEIKELMKYGNCNVCREIFRKGLATLQA